MRRLEAEAAVEARDGSGRVGWCGDVAVDAFEDSVIQLASIGSSSLSASFAWSKRVRELLLRP